MYKELLRLKQWHIDFCKEYVKNGNNGARAYRKCKPEVTETTSRVMSCTLLKSQIIMDEINKIKSEITSDTTIDILHRRQLLSEIAQDTSYKAADRINAIKELNNMDPDLTKQSEITNTNEVHIDISKLSDAELKNLVGDEDE